MGGNLTALIRELCALLETDDPKLKDVPFKEKRDLLAFFEEVAATRAEEG